MTTGPAAFLHCFVVCCLVVVPVRLSFLSHFLFGREARRNEGRKARRTEERKKERERERERGRKREEVCCNFGKMCFDKPILLHFARCSIAQMFLRPLPRCSAQPNPDIFPKPTGPTKDFILFEYTAVIAICSVLPPNCYICYQNLL